MVPGVKNLAAIGGKLPEPKHPLLGLGTASEGNCGSGTGTGTALGDRFLPSSPLLGQSTVDELAPQLLNPSLLPAEPSGRGPKPPVAQRAHTSLSPRHEGDNGDPPQPSPLAAPDTEGSSPLPALHISISAGARGLQSGRSGTWDPSAAALWALTGLVAPDTGHTGDPAGTPSFLGPRGLPRPTECKRPPSSRDTSGLDILAWLRSIAAGEGFCAFINSNQPILLFYWVFETVCLGADHHPSSGRCGCPWQGEE